MAKLHISTAELQHWLFYSRETNSVCNKSLWNQNQTKFIIENKLYSGETVFSVNFLGEWLYSVLCLVLLAFFGGFFTTKYPDFMDTERNIS